MLIADYENCTLIYYMNINKTKICCVFLLLEPGIVQNFNQKINSDGSVTLTWDPPFGKGSDNPRYVVTYGSTSRTTSDTKYTIKSDTQTKSYTVQVSAVDHAILFIAFTYTIFLLIAFFQ